MMYVVYKLGVSSEKYYPDLIKLCMTVSCNINECKLRYRASYLN